MRKLISKQGKLQRVWPCGRYKCVLWIPGFLAREERWEEARGHGLVGEIRSINSENRNKEESLRRIFSVNVAASQHSLVPEEDDLKPRPFHVTLKIPSCQGS